MGQIVYGVSAEEYFTIFKAAGELGYRTVNEFARVKMLEWVGLQPRTLDDGRPKITVNESAIIQSLRERPKTLKQICEQSGKHYPVLHLVMRNLIFKGWVVEERRDVFTGGRPATSYAATDLGIAQLDAEAERRKKAHDRAEHMAALQRAESAKRNPDPATPKPAPRRLSIKDTENEVYTEWMKAGLDALYNVTPPLSDEQITEKLTTELARMHTFVNMELGTWAEQTEMLKREGWFEV